MKRLGAIGVGIALLSLLAPVHAGAVDYPPGSTTTPTTIVPPETTAPSTTSPSTIVPPENTTTTGVAPPPGKPPNNVGPKPGGSQFTNEACGFKPNSAV